MVGRTYNCRCGFEGSDPHKCTYKGRDNVMVTAAEVKKAVLAKGIKTIEHHTCAACDCWVNYFVEGENLFFDSSCDCSSSGHGMEPREWQEAADWINMQSNLCVELDLKSRFGIC